MVDVQIRNSFVLGTLWAAKRNALVVGSSGTGKTVLAFSELARLPETHSQLVMNFSATTDSGTTQARSLYFFQCCRTPQVFLWKPLLNGLLESVVSCTGTRGATARRSCSIPGGALSKNVAC